MNTGSENYYMCDVNVAPIIPINNPYNFPLDPFQQHAASAIDKGHHVLVCAKTGSGKTLVADYAIKHSLAQGKRIFYTTPIKSLSNQKYHDLSVEYGKTHTVGIMTGDIKVNPQGSIVVMTTEILRNLLYKCGTATENLGITAALSLEDVGCVVFDECHYINDRDRGGVWEESFILMPVGVQMVLLSATLDRPQEFADWLGGLKRVPIALIQTAYRVVPLIHNITGVDGALIPIMDSREKFDAEAYKKWGRDRKKAVYDLDKYREKVKDARAGGVEGAISGKVTINSFMHVLNQTVEELNRKELMPALCFVFSRKECERYAHLISGTLFGDDMDAGFHAHRFFDFHLRHHKKTLETMQSYHTIRELVGRGIAFHHSGLLPILKEVLELLFSGGFLKLMFCTETFAVGLNMPTKTVLFTGLRKYADDCDGLRLLRHDEYTQMAGRAGRRGKDTIGYVIYLPDREPVSVFEIQDMLKGALPTLESHMTFGYEFLLKTLNNSEHGWNDVLHSSYWYKQHRGLMDEAAAKLRISEETATSLTPEISTRADVEQYYTWTCQIKSAVNAEKKELQRKIEQWKNKHIGPRWVGALKAYDDYTKAMNTVEIARAQCANLANYTNPIMHSLEFLSSGGFIDIETKTLTTLGIAASECNEAHALLFPKFFYDDGFLELNIIDIVGICAGFVSVGKADDAPALHQIKMSPLLRESFDIMCSYIEKFKMLEERHGCKSEPAYMEIHTDMIEPLMEWMSDVDVHAGALCEKYGVFEGNFVKAVLKVSNIVDELGAIATYANNTALLEKLEGVRGFLVRDVVKPDSLYLYL